MSLLPIYRPSFFCNPERLDGVGLSMTWEDGMVQSEILVDNRFQGYSDVIHGGILVGILDSMMWYAILLQTKRVCMTRNLNTDFYKRVLCDTVYRAKSQFLKIEDKDVYATAWVEDGNGNICAKCTGTFREAKDILLSTIIDRFDFSGAAPDIKAYMLSLLDDKQEPTGDDKTSAVSVIPDERTCPSGHP